jgi:hypothetical protein
MYKMMLLIPPRVDLEGFDIRWPEFLHLAEQMPGLDRESSSLILEELYGQQAFSRIYEFFFPDKEALVRGMTSPAGEKAGRLIHEMTGGQLTILIAEHKEDQLANLHPPSIHEAP